MHRDESVSPKHADRRPKSSVRKSRGKFVERSILGDSEDYAEIARFYEGDVDRERSESVDSLCAQTRARSMAYVKAKKLAASAKEHMKNRDAATDLEDELSTELKRLRHQRSKAKDARESELQNQSARMSTMNIEDRIKLTKEEKVLKKFEKMQASWKRHNEIARKKLKKKESELVQTRSDMYREVVEEYKVVHKAIPDSEKNKSAYWLMSLRNDGTRYVRVGNMFSGLYCAVKKEDKKMPLIVRHPRSLATENSNDADGWRTSGSLGVRKKQLRRTIKSIRPHMIGDEESANLIVCGVDLFEWATSSTSQTYERAIRDSRKKISTKGAESSDATSPATKTADELSETKSTHANSCDVLPGPHLVLSSEEENATTAFDRVSEAQSSNLVLESRIGSESKATFWVRNVGTCAVYYQWQSQRVVRCLSGGRVRSGSSGRGQNPFYCADKRGVLLPGERRPFVVTFRAASKGIFRHSWLLETTPKSCNEGKPIVLNLRGAAVSACEPIAVKSHIIQRQIERRKLLTFAQNIVYAAVDRATCAPSSHSVFVSERSRRVAFEHTNKNVNYSPATWSACLSIAENAWHYVHGPLERLEPWNGSVSSLRSRIDDVAAIDSSYANNLSTRLVNVLRAASIRDPGTSSVYRIARDCVGNMLNTFAAKVSEERYDQNTTTNAEETSEMTLKSSEQNKGDETDEGAGSSDDAKLNDLKDVVASAADTFVDRMMRRAYAQSLQLRRSLESVADMTDADVLLRANLDLEIIASPGSSGGCTYTCGKNHRNDILLRRAAGAIRECLERGAKRVVVVGTCESVSAAATADLPPSFSCVAEDLKGYLDENCSLQFLPFGPSDRVLAMMNRSDEEHANQEEEEEAVVDGDEVDDTFDPDCSVWILENLARSPAIEEGDEVSFAQVLAPRPPPNDETRKLQENTFVCVAGVYRSPTNGATWTLFASGHALDSNFVPHTLTRHGNVLLLPEGFGCLVVAFEADHDAVKSITDLDGNIFLPVRDMDANDLERLHAQLFRAETNAFRVLKTAAVKSNEAHPVEASDEIVSEAASKNEAKNEQSEAKPMISADGETNTVGSDLKTDDFDESSTKNVESDDEVRIDEMDIFANDEECTNIELEFTTAKRRGEILRSMCDVYVNDDLRTCSSTSAAEKMTSTVSRVMGPALAHEVAILAKLLRGPRRSFVLIVGGRPTLPKCCALSSMLPYASAVVFGGEMALTMLKDDSEKSSRLVPFVTSFCSRIRRLARYHRVVLHFPVDWTVRDRSSQSLRDQDDKEEEEGENGFRVLDAKNERIPSAEAHAYDVGPETQKMIASIVSSANEVVWMGLMGDVRYAQCRAGSRAVLNAMQAVHCTPDTLTITVGDETQRFVESESASEVISLCSAGGEVTTRILAGATIPGIEDGMDPPVEEADEKSSDDDDDEEEEEDADEDECEMPNEGASK
eukprot:g668.t1